MTIGMMRMMAVAVALLVSGVQFRFFDCNESPALSVVSAALTVLLIYATGEAIYWVATSDTPALNKLVTGMCVALGGVGLVVGVGLFTLVTHMCG